MSTINLIRTSLLAAVITAPSIGTAERAQPSASTARAPKVARSPAKPEGTTQVLANFTNLPPGLSESTVRAHVMAPAHVRNVRMAEVDKSKEIRLKNGGWGDASGRTEQCVAYFFPNGMEAAIYVNSPIGSMPYSLRGVVKDAFLASLKE